MTFSYADILIKITPDSIRATKNNVEVELDSTKRLFKVENLVLEMGESIEITNLADLVRFRVAQMDGFLELKTFGLSNDESSNGLLVQLNKLEPNLIEGSQIKQHRTSTLLINGKFKIDFSTNITLLRLNRYRRGLETCPQAKTSKSAHAIFFSFFLTLPSHEYD